MLKVTLIQAPPENLSSSLDTEADDKKEPSPATELVDDDDIPSFYLKYLDGTHRKHQHDTRWWWDLKELLLLPRLLSGFDKD